jgi:hypothetical protein
MAATREYGLPWIWQDIARRSKNYLQGTLGHVQNVRAWIGLESREYEP